MKKFNCPLMGAEIDEAVCFDIHMVVEKVAPKWTAPEKAVQTPEFESICLRCPNHRED